MAIEGTPKGSIPPWIIRVCDRLWKLRSPVWGTLICGTCLSILIGGLFTEPSAFPKLPIYWLYTHLFYVIMALAILVLLFALAYVVCQLPVSESESHGSLEHENSNQSRNAGKALASPDHAPSDHQQAEETLRQKYLAKLSGDQMMLALSGIPTGLVNKSVLLDKIFIHLLFHPAPCTNIQFLDKDELEPYEERRKNGLQVEQMTRLINEARLEQKARGEKTIDITELWQHLTREEPAAVIQGYPGIGKSTLLSRITLYMARRSLNYDDPDKVLSTLQPVQIPLFISLKEYAHSYKREQLSLLAFIKSNIPSLLPGSDITAVSSLIEGWLSNGLCLVMFDGLDEAVNQGDDMRREVQQEIRKFISLYRHRERRTGNYNRFLITSRIAGYDLDAFSPDHYRNYIIAYLQQEQMANFLPRWCIASVDPDTVGLSRETLEQQAHESSERLLQALRTNRGVEKLAQIPLLLTLMATMQQKGTELPRSRAELYEKVTNTLLDKRNYDKGIDRLPVDQAIERLGPLAYTMHEREHGLATEDEVLTALATAIGTPQGGGGTSEDVWTEASTYLKRFSERGGILVKRTSDFYGFFHRTFEEYFSARHVLNTIELQGTSEITRFVTLAHQQNDLWREPYLLAVAYKNLRGYSNVADQFIRTLFEAHITDMIPDTEQRLHDLLLVTTAIFESNETSIRRELKGEVADALLQCYTQALQRQNFQHCQRIEDILSEWLLTINTNAYKPPVLEVLKAHLHATADTLHQRSVLTLLTMIAQRIVNGAESIFAELVPPLLALAGYQTAVQVPGAETVKPAEMRSMSSDPSIVELARAALSFLDKRGPAGTNLRHVQQYFKDQPQYYRQLARYSLESGSLITPTVVPLREENYRRYEQAVNRWIKLRDRCKQDGIQEQDISNGATIQQELLASAEEVSYPVVTHILSMLQQAETDPEHWHTTWRDYLLTQLNPAGASDQLIQTCGARHRVEASHRVGAVACVQTCGARHTGYSTTDLHDPYSASNAVDYREIVLLYASLFVEEQDTKLIASSILAHYQSEEATMQRNAQYLRLSLCEDLRFLRDFTDLGECAYLRDPKHLRLLRLFRDLRYLR